MPESVVPVLLYHAVSEEPGDQVAPFTVSPAEFEHHLDAVLASGRTSVPFHSLAGDGAGAASGGPPSGGAGHVVVTFDDGYADFADVALPALRARGLTATLFVTTGWLSGQWPREPGPSDLMLSWSQLPELHEAGVELGAHSHSHPQMDTLTRSALREELVRSKELLEQALGAAVPSFAYPHGYNGPRVRRYTRESGYRTAAAVRNALHRPGADPYAVSRLMVTRMTTAADVARWLDGAGAPVVPRREALSTRGWRAYRRGAAMLRRAPGSAYR